MSGNAALPENQTWLSVSLMAASTLLKLPEMDFCKWGELSEGLISGKGRMSRLKLWT
jgi:hypothetical protein